MSTPVTPSAFGSRPVLSAARAAHAAMAGALGTEQGWSGVDWSTQAAPGMSTGHASTLQTVADACRDPRLATPRRHGGATGMSAPRYGNAGAVGRVRKARAASRGGR